MPQRTVTQQTVTQRPRANLALLAGLLLLASCAMSPRVHEQPVLMSRRVMSSNGVIPEGTPVPHIPGEARRGYIDYAKSPSEDHAQLWVRESFYVGRAALHPFFLIYDHKNDNWEQWEIWADDQFGYYETPQKRLKRYSDARGSQQVTFVQRQVGAVRCWTPMTYFDVSIYEHLVAHWSGDDARRLIDVLQQPETYPDRDGYWIWPGPNSNGYARWALDQASLAVDLDPRMVGKDWHGWLGFGLGLTPTRTGLHLDLLTLGAAVGLQDGIELHLLGFTFGIDLWPPALKTPGGRIGLPE